MLSDFKIDLIISESLILNVINILICRQNHTLNLFEGNEFEILIKKLEIKI